jgi:hypothetical protein
MTGRVSSNLATDRGPEGDSPSGLPKESRRKSPSGPKPRRWVLTSPEGIAPNASELGGFAEGRIISEHGRNDFCGVDAIAGHALAKRHESLTLSDAVRAHRIYVNRVTINAPP